MNSRSAAKGSGSLFSATSLRVIEVHYGQYHIDFRLPSLTIATMNRMIVRIPDFQEAVMLCRDIPMLHCECFCVP